MEDADMFEIEPRDRESQASGNQIPFQNKIGNIMFTHS
jgi:hypothetical protein